MSRTIALIARRPLRYQGRQIQAGEVFQADAVSSVSFRYRGQARFAPTAVTLPPAAPLPSPVPPLVVDTVATMDSAAPIPEAVWPSPEAPSPDVPVPDSPAPDAETDVSDEPRKKRRYRRRDLQADETTDLTVED
jgi:hypothetical protein